MTSPSVSDSPACANIARATRQKHSRFARSPAHFRNSLFFAFDLKKQPFRLFFLRQLPTSPRQGACSVGMQMDINHDVTGGALPRSKKKRPLDGGLFFLSNQDGKTIAEKALFYKGFGHFCCCKFRFTLLVFEPLTPMYFIKIFRNNKIVCGYTKKSPPI